MNIPFLSQKTVADIIAPLTKAVAELDAVVQDRIKQNDKYEAEILDLSSKQAKNTDEVLKAQKYKAAFEKLLNG